MRTIAEPEVGVGFGMCWRERGVCVEVRIKARWVAMLVDFEGLD